MAGHDVFRVHAVPAGPVGGAGALHQQEGVTVVRLVRRRWVALRSASESRGPLGLLVMMRRSATPSGLTSAAPAMRRRSAPTVDVWNC
jgi:hypothetical protein